MRRYCGVASIISVLLAGAGCVNNGEDTAITATKNNPVVEERIARLNASLASSASSDERGKPIARWNLPRELAEISGLALTPDGRLFAHNDETARITEIDYRRGTIIKHFYVGDKNLGADFEGITYAENRFVLLSSNGVLYEFPEGADGEGVAATVRDTHLGKECEFEGVTYDANANVIVMACKNAGKQQSKNMLVLYRYGLGEGAETSELTIPQSKVIGKNNWKQVRPTDITVDPSNGNYVLVSAQERALVVLTPAGDVVLSRPLEGQHPQAEGIAITSDHILIISDELTTRAASITLYRWP